MGRRPGDAGRQGRVRCPRAKPHQLCSRAVRASCLPALRPACGVRRWKWGDRRRSDPRPLDGLPTKPGPDRTKGLHTPWAEPWWNAGRRARPRAEGRCKPHFPWRDPRAVLACGEVLTCVCRRSASLISFVIASGSEAIQSGRYVLDCFVAELVIGPATSGRARWFLAMTHRKRWLFDITRARKRPRARDYFSPLRGGERSAARSADG